MTFEEVKADYEKLTGDYGYPNDMSGAFVDAEKMEPVILNPTKLNAKKYLIEVIEYGFQCGEHWCIEDWSNGGKDLSIHEDKFLKKMYNKYII